MTETPFDFDDFFESVYWDVCNGCGDIVPRGKLYCQSCVEKILFAIIKSSGSTSTVFTPKPKTNDS
jgi:hypothetical protein